MRQQPGFDGLPIIRVAVGRDDRLAHELPRYRTGKFISEHLVRSEWHDDRALRLRGRGFRLRRGSFIVVGVARRRRVHGTVDCLCSKIGLVDRLKVARAAAAVQNKSRACLC